MERGSVTGEYLRSCGEEEDNAEDNGTTQSTICYTCVEAFKLGLGTGELRIVAPFRAGIPVSSAWNCIGYTGVRCCHRDPFIFHKDKLCS